MNDKITTMEDKIAIGMVAGVTTSVDEVSRGCGESGCNVDQASARLGDQKVPFAIVGDSSSLVNDNYSLTLSQSTTQQASNSQTDQPITARLVESNEGDLERQLREQGKRLEVQQQELEQYRQNQQQSFLIAEIMPDVDEQDNATYGNRLAKWGWMIVAGVVFMLLGIAITVALTGSNEQQDNSLTARLSSVSANTSEFMFTLPSQGYTMDKTSQTFFFSICSLSASF
jgi:hypothetical protein